MGDEGDNRPTKREPTTFEKFFQFYLNIVDKPVTLVREKIVEPRQENRPKYYHRKYPRVPTIDECDVEDAVCYYEANSQFKRDRMVDTQILNVLRKRRMDCEIYYGPDAYPNHCAQAKEDFISNETNWFVKYGDLGASANAKSAYMKQKHRMIWERRHGPVGTGMSQQS